jgi:hypothetical protein
MQTICAWCFPGLLVINGETVSHGICKKHYEKVKKSISSVVVGGRSVEALSRGAPQVASADGHRQAPIIAACVRFVPALGAPVVWQNYAGGHARKVLVGS